VVVALGCSPESVRDGERTFRPDGRYLGYLQAYDRDIEFLDGLPVFPFPPSHILAEDDGSLWFTVFSGSDSDHYLYRYDTHSGSLDSFALPNSPATGFFSEFRRAPGGGFLLAYGFLVIEVNTAGQVVRRFDLGETPDVVIDQGVVLEGTWVTGMTVGEDGRMYVSRMNNPEITVIDPATGETSSMPVPAGFGAVVQIEAAAPEGLYISNWLGGLSMEPATAYLSPGGELTLVAGPASAFVRGANGLVYAATLDGSVVALDGESVRWVANLPPQAEGEKVYLAADVEGERIWFASRRGGVLGSVREGRGSLAHRLPFYVIPAEERECLIGDPCQDVVTFTQVDGLTVGPGGEVYFSDATLHRLGRLKGSAR
jgi:streptogramin lyase